MQYFTDYRTLLKAIIIILKLLISFPQRFRKHKSMNVYDQDFVFRKGKDLPQWDRLLAIIHYFSEKIKFNLCGESTKENNERAKWLINSSEIIIHHSAVIGGAVCAIFLRGYEKHDEVDGGRPNGFVVFCPIC